MLHASRCNEKLPPNGRAFSLQIHRKIEIDNKRKKRKQVNMTMMIDRFITRTTASFLLLLLIAAMQETMQVAAASVGGATAAQNEGGLLVSGGGQSAGCFMFLC